MVQVLVLTVTEMEQLVIGEKKALKILEVLEETLEVLGELIPMELEVMEV